MGYSPINVPDSSVAPSNYNWNSIQKLPISNPVNFNVPFTQGSLKSPVKQTIKRQPGLCNSSLPKTVCELCNTAFPTVDMCEKHKREFHNITVKSNSFVCQYCSKPLSNRNNLRNHIILKHTKVSTLMCPKCSQAFVHKKLLLKHMENCAGKT